jgi:[protein-PII] uridylyltransferase
LIELFERVHLYPIIKILYLTSTISKLLPPFEKVMFFPQFDGYHKHPVDIHSIYNIREIERISISEINEFYETLSIEDRKILKLASLFHDIGKGRIEEHSRVGAKVIRSFLKDFGENDETIERVSLLIRYHTLMTDIAYHEDIYSEKVIFGFTSKLKDERNLKLLYLLTYADVKSVNERSFNSYNGRLLKSLYNGAILSFDKEEMLKESEKREKRERQISNNENFKALPKSLQRSILDIKSNFALFKLSIDEIIRISINAKTIQGFSFEIENIDSLSVRVMRDKTLNFDIAYVLNKLNFLSVISLDIFKFFDGVKYFQIDFAERVSEDDELLIGTIIEESFYKNRKRFNKVSPIIKADEVSIDCDYSNSYVRLRVHTLNQNGLLAYLFKLFEDEKIDVISSKTQTFKKRVKDTFLFNRDSEGCHKYEVLLEKLVSK